MTNPNLSRLGLRFNPFEPAASGAPVTSDLWIPDRWKVQVEELIERIDSASGVKALAIEGEYGSGKTYILRWLERSVFPNRRIRPFFFDNPGVQFYDLANSLFRQIGRYEFSKSLWEYVRPELSSSFASWVSENDEFMTWLKETKARRRYDVAKKQIADALQSKGITQDEEIAYRLANIVVQTLDKPYFEYRDFVAGRKESLVAENEEARYFSAIIRALSVTSGARGIAFLLDEFEEVSLQKRLSRKQAYDYLATLKRLVNTTQDEDFWLIIGLTPQASEISRQLEPALWQRFTGEGNYQFTIPPLNIEEATELMRHRLHDAQTADASSPLWPFGDEAIRSLQPTTYSSPRRLVKVAFYAIAEAAAASENIVLPFETTFIQEIEANVYPRTDEGQIRD